MFRNSRLGAFSGPQFWWVFGALLHECWAIVCVVFLRKNHQKWGYSAQGILGAWSLACSCDKNCGVCSRGGPSVQWQLWTSSALRSSLHPCCLLQMHQRRDAFWVFPLGKRVSNGITVDFVHLCSTWPVFSCFSSFDSRSQTPNSVSFFNYRVRKHVTDDWFGGLIQPAEVFFATSAISSTPSPNASWTNPSGNSSNPWVRLRCWLWCFRFSKRSLSSSLKDSKMPWGSCLRPSRLGWTLAAIHHFHETHGWGWLPFGGWAQGTCLMSFNVPRKWVTASSYLAVLVDLWNIWGVPKNRGNSSYHPFMGFSTK